MLGEIVNVLHANGFHMAVTIEPIAEAIARIGPPAARSPVCDGWQGARSSANDPPAAPNLRLAEGWASRAIRPTILPTSVVGNFVVDRRHLDWFHGG